MPHDDDCIHPRPRDPRFARQPDHRGRCAARRRGQGTRRRAVRRIDGKPRGRRAARRRPAPLRRQGRHAGGRERERCHRAGAARSRGRRSGGGRRATANSRRHRRRSPAWVRTPSSASRSRSRARRPRAPACRSVPVPRRGGSPTVPVPMFNVLNGGAHADTSVDLQEFMIAPVGRRILPRGSPHGRRELPGAQGHLEGKGLHDGGRRRGRLCAEPQGERRGDRARCFAAIERAGLRPGSDIVLALDPAASEFFEEGAYVFRKSDGSRRTSAQMVEFYEDWVRQFPIWSIEDGLAEDDWDGWRSSDRAPRASASSSWATTSS